MFYATAFHDSYNDGKLTFQENNEDAAFTSRCNAGNNNFVSASEASLTLQATLDLNKDDTIKVTMNGDFKYLDDHFSTYFEGRLLTCHLK